MLNYVEPVLIALAFALSWDYAQPEPLLWSRQMVPAVTLEERRAAEWLASLRPPVTRPHPGTRARQGSHRAGRRAPNPFPASHYTRNH